MAVNYVQFYRGSLQAYEAATKNRDTLYFVTNSDDNRSYLYLGDKLITGSITDLNGLEDILLTDVDNNHLMVYDEAQKKWVNKSVLQAIGVMTGANVEAQGTNGLVPAPGIGMQDAFLRGDGTWVKIPVSEGVALVADEKSVSILDKTIALKDFGVKYYKFIAETGSEEEGNLVEAHYEAQLVDVLHPWAAGLEPKVVEENGELVLGWFEPNPTTVDGINSKITILEKEVGNLTSDVSLVQESLSTVTEEVAKKANSENVYTKSETDDKIAQAVVDAEHLKRKTFNSIQEAEQFATSTPNADKYIYMVLSSSATGNNQYDEYLLVEGKLERVGDWGVDLTDYATKDQLDNYVQKIDGYSLISDTNVAKLDTIEANAQKNLFDSVNGEEFFIDENRKLNLQSIEIAKVKNLSDTLFLLSTSIDNKVDAVEFQTVKSSLENKIEKLENNYSTLSTKVQSLQTSLTNNYITKTEFAVVEEAITWQELPNA